MHQEKLKTLRVLVVDDHAYFRESLVSFLSEFPWVDVVGAAEDGIEACGRAIVLSPDVIIMDVIMPGENGIEAAKRIKGDLPSTKIILYSMYDFDFSSREEIITADRFIPKQRLFMDLIQTIREICRINSE